MGFATLKLPEEMKSHRQLRIRQFGEFRFVLRRALDAVRNAAGKAYFEIRTDGQTNENSSLTQIRITPTPRASPPTFELEQVVMRDGLSQLTRCPNWTKQIAHKLSEYPSDVCVMRHSARISELQ